MRRRVSCEQQLNMSQSVLSGVMKITINVYIFFNKRKYRNPRKGIRLIFLNLDTERVFFESNHFRQER
jgi:hypothetical protein